MRRSPANSTNRSLAAFGKLQHIRDSRWAEGFDGTNGWLIDSRVDGDNHEIVDAVNADALERKGATRS